MNQKNLNIKTSEKLELISNLTTMLSAGISILEIVDSLTEDTKGNQKKLLEELRADLVQGNHVAYSFAKFPRVFDTVTVNLISAAEETGTLDVTLKDLTESIKRETEFKDKIKAALAYPLIIFVVFFGVLLMILFVVIPKISVVYKQLHAPLPLPTQILIWMSNILTTYTIQVFSGGILIIIVLAIVYKKNRKVFAYALFSLPLISNLGRQIDLTRFTRSMHLLLSAGIPISTSLELAEGTVFKREVGKAIEHSREAVVSGKKLSDGFKETKHVFPSIMIKITEAGEKSGSLEKSMQDISIYLEYQVSNTLQTVTALLEPIMLVVVGIVVGGMMIAIITPIYGIINEVSIK